MISPKAVVAAPTRKGLVGDDSRTLYVLSEVPATLVLFLYRRYDISWYVYGMDF